MNDVQLATQQNLVEVGRISCVIDLTEDTIALMQKVLEMNPGMDENMLFNQMIRLAGAKFNCE